MDLDSVIERAGKAQALFKQSSQERVDLLCERAVEASVHAAEDLAQAAVLETGYGHAPSKVEKNLFATRFVWQRIKDMKTCGPIGIDPVSGCQQYASPVGVIAGIIPVTNPTSTALFKALIAIKSRNAIIMAPHPKAEGCILKACQIFSQALQRSGAPDHLVQCLTASTLEQSQALMQHPGVHLILATGGKGLVEAAYSAGKPAFGVGPGNVPCYIHESADLQDAAHAVVISQRFDYGTLCCSEQSLVVDRKVSSAFKKALEKEGAVFLNPAQSQALEQAIMGPRGLKAEFVGQSPQRLAKAAGLSLADGTALLICPLKGIGPEHPFSRETLCPLLGWLEVSDWQEGCTRAKELLNFGGLGHTFAIHAHDPAVISAFGQEKPASRLLVNSPSSQGAIGLSTTLFPSMTLGCGVPAGNISSDNIGPQHLIHIKRLAPITPGFYNESIRGSTPPAASRISQAKGVSITTPAEILNSRSGAKLRE